ncbi:MAG: biopolymer transporter ExbD [Terriglobia bacterium]
MKRRIMYNAVPRVAMLLVLIFLVIFHAWPKHSSGFRVRIAPNTCACPDASIIEAHVSANGELLINSEPMERAALTRLLTDIYGTRYEGVVYVSGDENVSYQRVIDVIEALPQVKRPPTRMDLPIPEALRTAEDDALNIEIQLVTPGVANTPCPEDCYNWEKQSLLRLP